MAIFVTEVTNSIQFYGTDILFLEPLQEHDKVTKVCKSQSLPSSAVKRSIGEVVQSRRRPLLGLSHLRHF